MPGQSAIFRTSALALLLLSLGAPASASIWPSAARRVERLLSDGDVEARRRGAKELGELTRASARRLVGVALSDPDVEVRLAAVEVARRLGLADLGARLSAWLSDPEPRIRLAAAETLREEPSSNALPALGRASSDADPRVRSAVARALGASESGDAVVPLLGRLDDPVPDVRRDVVSALGRLGDRRAVVPLLARVMDPVAAVRRVAARSLGELGDARAVSALVLVLRDADEGVRVAALEAVGRLGDASAVSSVIAGLDDGTPAVRAAALGALGRLGTPDAFAALVARLGQSDLDLEQVLTALDRAGARTLPALRACVDTQSVLGAADGCVRALARVGDAGDVDRVRAALERGAATPPVALAAFGELGGPNALPPALERLSDPDPAVRVAAATALLELLDPAHPDGRAVDPLLRALRARGVPVLERALLVRLLGLTGAVRAGEPLARVARESTELLLVLAAYAAFGDLGQAGFDAILLHGLDHEEGAVRGAAALSLRRVGSGKTARALIERLGRPEQDRDAIGIALPGVVSRADDRGLPAVLTRLLRETRGALRDALIEALAATGEGGAAALAELARSRDPADRAKLAEVLGGAAAGRGALAALAKDGDARVRASAVWSLGSGGSPEDVPALLGHLGDPDPAVAANAAAALGRVTRAGSAPVEKLCGALADKRPGVRANALAALRLAASSTPSPGEPCGAGAVARLLRRDPVPSVRMAAARLLSLAKDTAREPLARCADQDESSAVARVCAAPPAALPTSFEPLLAYVVPVGETDPVPLAPFALAFADGTLRLGSADRRGAVFDPHAPKGLVNLELVPIRDAPRGM
jgi:cellulose synthase operon protein C